MANIVGDSGNDTLLGTPSADTINGNDGNDFIQGDGGYDYLFGGNGADAIHTGEDGGHAEGYDGDDYLLAQGAANSSLYGEDGNDTLVGGDGNILAYGGQGNDEIYTEGIGGEAHGNDGDDFIRAGGIGGIRLLGQAGNDTLIGGWWGDVYTVAEGGEGNDLFQFYNSGNAKGDAGDDVFKLSDFEDVAVGGTGNDTLEGYGDQDSLQGGEGNDAIYGGGQNDTIGGGEGHDLLDGGDGNDSIAGEGGDDTFSGGAGNDTILGGRGRDQIDGGAGRDRMSGGADNDFYIVDDAGDVIIELSSAESPNGGFDVVNTILGSYKLPENVERVNYKGSSTFVGVGNSGNNRFTGGGIDDRFVDLLGGNDTISGGHGVDTMDFRASLTGVVLNFLTNVHSGAAAGDIYASIEKYLGSNSANDSMTGGGAGRFDFAGGGGNDTLVGAGNIDQLQGQDGHDVLSGLAGVDTLIGGAGNDTLTGGAAKDYFVYSAAGFGQDIITDFQDGLDQLKVRTSVANSISAFSVTGNGTTSVVLTLVSNVANTITINGSSAINVTAADFQFY